MKIGVSPIGWTNDDMPSMGADYTFERCISDMAKAGYQGCEIGVKFPRDIAYLKQCLASHQLQVCNQWFDFRLTTDTLEHNLQRLEAHISFLKQLGCETVGGGEVGLSCQKKMDHSVYAHRGHFSSQRQRSEFYSALNECGAFIHSHGMRLAFHHHMGSVVQSLDDVLRLLDNTEEHVGLNYDSGHFAFALEDPIIALNEVKTRVNHIHLKNIRRSVLEKVKRKKWSFLKAVQEGVFTAPGDPDGDINFHDIFNILQDIEYSHWIVVEAEQDPAKADPFEYAMMARKLIKSRLGL